MTERSAKAARKEWHTFYREAVAEGKADSFFTYIAGANIADRAVRRALRVARRKWPAPPAPAEAPTPEPAAE